MQLLKYDYVPQVIRFYSRKRGWVHIIPACVIFCCFWGEGRGVPIVLGIENIFHFSLPLYVTFQIYIVSISKYLPYPTSAEMLVQFPFVNIFCENASVCRMWRRTWLLSTAARRRAKRRTEEGKFRPFSSKLFRKYSDCLQRTFSLPFPVSFII